MSVVVGRTAWVAALFMAVSSPSMADTDGCPDGTVSTTLSGGNALTTFFDAFVPAGGERATCALSVDTGVAHAGDRFFVYSADYRGSMLLEPGERAELLVRQGQMIDPKRFGGPYDGDLEFSNFVSSDPDGLINSQVTLDLLQAGEFSGAALDTIDYALVATTSLDEVHGSLDRVARARSATTFNLQVTANLLSGFNQPVSEADGEIAMIGGVGSYLAGVTARHTMDSGLTVRGGAAWFDMSAKDTDTRGVMFAGSLQYVMGTADQTMRPFIEAGLRAAPLSLTIGRNYSDGSADGVDVDTGTDGVYGGGYARAGVVFQPDAANQIDVSGTLSHSILRTDGFAEQFGADNLFSASTGDETTALTTLALGATWTGQISPALEVSANAAAGYGFGHGGTRSDVSFVGALDTDAVDEAFAEFGARAKYTVAENFDASLFAQGGTGAKSGTHIFYGATLGRKF